MLVSEITNRVSEILQDDDADFPNVTWTLPDIIEWLNDGLRVLVDLRPDASAVTASILLVAGTKQSLSADGDLSLIKLTRNMGADGATPGKVITLADMDAMDRFNPDWHTDDTDTVVQNYMYNEARPDEFWVYPPIPSTPNVYVEGIKAVAPTKVAAAGDTLPVDGIYAPALISWCVYRAFSRDSEETPNNARAVDARQTFFNLIQGKSGGDRTVDPNVRELARQGK